MNKQDSKKIIVVTGDVTIDWNIARVRRGGGATHVWNADDVTSAFCQRGGAAMLADLVKSIAEDLAQSRQAHFEVRQTNAPRHPVTPDDKRFHHSYATWAPFDLNSPGSGQRRVWRVQEFLGLYQAHANTDSPGDWKKVVNDPDNPALIILDDADLGFRDHPEYWPQALSSNISKPRIILKMARPVAQGKLWHHLQKNHAERLVVVITVNDLRRSQVQISRQVSWERTAQDLVWELLYNPHVNALTQCAHVIVSFDTAGAILLSRGSESTPDAVLFFDPNAMEGEWGLDHQGYMIGYTTCLTAGIAREVMLNASDPKISCGIQSGIRAMRFLHVEGYGHASDDPKQVCLAFPTLKIAANFTEDGNPLAAAPIRNPSQALPEKADATSAGEADHFWTVLESQNTDSLDNIAERIVRNGLEHALSDVPIGRFGKLTTVDRKEIEALNSISGLISEYCKQQQQRPLSIAVFGPPGSGKSFSVKQVANSVRLGEMESLTFNLSQFGRPEDLLDAFHQVRDKALSGKIPLVFWDEFDTPLREQSLGWLRYFLAPMQDGEFQEGQITHPIGRSIFVFAGGMSQSVEAFGASLDEEKRKAVKLPDFISRLKGFLNILGPNRQRSESAHGRFEDPYYVIRRAILLRSIFEHNTPQLLRNNWGKRVVNIDQGLLNAFLLTKEYKHGARSMEAILAMSQLADKTNFERSSLPSETQLNLHVDGREFFALMHRMEPGAELLEKLAEAAHEVFCDNLRSEGYKKYGTETRKDKKVHSSLGPYTELPEDEREQNRDNVRDIPNKLAIVGYAVVPARSNEAPRQFADDEIKKLAEMEHERWMQKKLDTGWAYAKATDKTRKLHPCLVPWDKLPEGEKNKDRVLVKGITTILAKAGYTMVKLGP